MWELITAIVAAVVGGTIAAATPRVQRAFDLIGKREGRLMGIIEWNLKVMADLPEGIARDIVQADIDRALTEIVEIRQAAIPRRSVDPKQRTSQLRRDAISGFWWRDSLYRRAAVTALATILILAPTPFAH